MTQKFPLLFAPFRLRKHGLRSRIIVTGHAGKRTKLGYRVLKPTPTPAVYFLPPSSHRGKQRRLVVEGRNPAPYGPQNDRHFIPLLQHYSECLSS